MINHNQSTIEETQRQELKLLDAFIDVCNKFKLKWFVESGTLLGAVREHGFIPWDDDIDVCMPRDDYNKFLKLGYAGTIFNDGIIKLQTAVTDPEYFCVNARLRLEGTTCISLRELYKKSNKGIFIDVYPLDAIPNDKAEVDAETGFVRAIGKYSDVEKEGKDVVSIDAFNCMNDVLTSITHKNENSKFVGFVIFYRYSSMQYARFTRSCYASSILMPFKGLKNKVNVPVGYDQILKTWYGDYMTPSKSGTLHDSFFDPCHSYTDYDKNKDLLKDIEDMLTDANKGSIWE